MRSALTIRALALTVTSLAGSCMFTTDSCACVPAPRTAIVYGTITAQGDPVGDAAVNVTIPGLPDSLSPWEEEVTSTNGRYRSVVLDQYGTGTLILRVTPPSASGLRPDSVSFRPPFSNNQPTDSMRVDVALLPQ